MYRKTIDTSVTVPRGASEQAVVRAAQDRYPVPDIDVLDTTVDSTEDDGVWVNAAVWVPYAD